MSVYGHMQTGFQRYAAMPTTKKAKQCVFLPLSQGKMFHFQFQMCVHLSIYLFRVVLLTMPGSFLLGTLASLAGLCIFAHFTNIGCDPLADGKISNPNQVDSLHFY